ncbi:hypothetical protein PINS_up016274 [Pythium insidiosum]|nr:hypothetical protein PINS_up016274 [Pythium insidiosum]
MAAIAKSAVCVVLDGANVATRKDQQRVIARLAAAITFFQSHDAVRCVAFVPRFWLPSPPATSEVDDPALLQRLVDQELVVLTAVARTRRLLRHRLRRQERRLHRDHDMFRDHVQNGVRQTHFTASRDSRAAHAASLFYHVVNSACFRASACRSRGSVSAGIDFTFVGLEFLPNSQVMARVLGHQPSPRRRSQRARPRLRVDQRARAVPAVRWEAAASLGGLDQTDDSDAGDDAVDAVEDDMAVDHVRKKNVDLSEMTSYRWPRHLLPLLHGDDGRTMQRFQDHTDTYIVVPTTGAAGSHDAVTLTIYGCVER